MSPEKVIVSNDFDENKLQVGDIIFYVNSQLEHPTEYEHPHVIVGIEGNFLYTVCGTSQQQTIEDLIQRNGFDYSLFPAIAPCGNNKLSKTTFCDCTCYFDIEKHKLQAKYQKGEVVKYAGKITYAEYEQIRIAIKSLPTSDINDLLVHEED